jgi:hypothetical protein
LVPQREVFERHARRVRRVKNRPVRIRVSMLAILDEAGRKFNADKLDGISRRDKGEFGPNAPAAPGRILPRHPPDQLAKLGVEPLPADRLGSGRSTDRSRRSSEHPAIGPDVRTETLPDPRWR